MRGSEKYLRSFVMGVQNSLEYRLSFLLSLISTIFPIIIQFFLWTAIFKATSGSTVYGYTFNQIIMYTVMAGLVSKIIATGFEYEVNDDIKNGGLNKFIVRPLGHFKYRLSRFLGEKVSSLIVLFLVSLVIISVLKFIIGLDIGLVNIIGFIFTLIMAITLNFMIYYSVSMLPFWISEAAKLFGTINIVLIVFSGGIFPLDIFGDKILSVINLLPFKYTIQFPIDILNGRISSGAILEGIIIQISWICALLLLTNTLWKIGLRRYAAIGG